MKKSNKKELTVEQEKQVYMYEKYIKHHRKPVTRREFLASGLIASTATIMLPSALSLISQSAFADQCKAAGASGLPAFVNINLSGGASIAGNFRPLDKNGGVLSNYSGVGLGSKANVESITLKPFGETGAAVASVSGIYNGIITQNTGATPTTLAKTSSLLLCVTSTDDTANNPIDATPMIAKARSSIGAFLPPLGPNRNQPAILPTVPALAVGSFTDIQNAIGVNGAIANMTPANKQSIFRMIASLSESQKSTLNQMSGADVLTRLVSEATGKNIDLIGGDTSTLSPVNVPGLDDVWNFNNANELRDASIIYNVLMDNAPAANFTLGGFDYHQQGRPTQDTKDAEAGALIGRLLQTAALVGKPLCISLTSDGSVGHANSTDISAATGDQGTNGSAVAFFFDPNKRPDQSAPQVGGFVTNGSGVDESTPVGGSPANAMAAIVANYLSFAKKAGSFNDVAGPNVFNQDQLTQVIKIFG